ncbi:hypothetical protein I4U23_015622 [Adineta vaga]|nr:hypothetical protein I4U23_015622 [Adineta vaga]
MTSQTKNIYFVRHGERVDHSNTQWAKDAQFPNDPPLHDNGKQQANELGVYAAQLQPRITHIYASPFLRTIQTALIIADRLNQNSSSSNVNTKIRIEPGFGEFYEEEYEWNSKRIFRAVEDLVEIPHNTEYFDKNYQSLFNEKYYLDLGIEKREHLRDRLKRMLQRLLEVHKDDCNILIVTHAATVIEGARAFITLTKEQDETLINKEQVTISLDGEKRTDLSWDMTLIEPGVCSLTHFEFVDNKWKLKSNALTSYLSRGKQYQWVFTDEKSLYKTSKLV